MKIWLDTANLETVKRGAKLGILYGVTTNPAIIAESGKPMRTVLQSLLDIQDGPVTGQVVGHSAQEMIDQGLELYDFSDRIIVKVPVTQEGLEAIQALKAQSIPTMATVVLHPHQALIAALIGADYIAPYIGQIERNGQDPLAMLQAISKCYQNYQVKTEILCASIGSLEQICRCAELGMPHVTLKEALFSQLLATDPKTQERINHFETVWQKSGASFL